MPAGPRLITAERTRAQSLLSYMGRLGESPEFHPFFPVRPPMPHFLLRDGNGSAARFLFCLGRYAKPMIFVSIR